MYVCHISRNICQCTMYVCIIFKCIPHTTVVPSYIHYIYIIQHVPSFTYLYSTTEKFSQKVFTKSLLLKNLKKEHKVVRGREEKKTNDYATRL